MTTIIGSIVNSNVYMAADNAVTDDSIVVLADNSKISRHDNFLLGFIGSVSIGTLLSSRTFESIPSENTIGYLYDEFIPFCRKQIRKAKCDEKELEVTQLLLGHETGIYEIILDPPIVVRHLETAVGSGANFALGAMYARHTSNIFEKMDYAMRAAETYDPFTKVRGKLEVNIL